MKCLQYVFGMCIDVLNEGNKRGCTGSPLGLPVGLRPAGNYGQTGWHISDLTEKYVGRCNAVGKHNSGM